ncbi:MAG: LamG domain-containing protein [Sedimentisphaerales bacterium]|nr:LamG domain-containing protein [Sedimentisphaerales bacterium]
MDAKKGFLILALIVLVNSTTLAAWDPNTDPNLIFNLNFEDNDIPGMLTYAVYPTGGSLTGTIDGYNAYPGWDHNDFWVFPPDGIRRTSGDFHYTNDDLPHGGYPNDVVVKFNGRQEFELGVPDKKHTWALWFNDTDYNEANVPQDTLEYSSFVRYLLTYSETIDYYSNWWWELRINAGKLEFREGRGHISFETESSLADLGVTPGQWHHAAVVIDRSTETGSKIYIDGLEVPVVINAYNDMAASTFDSGSYYTRMRIGAGEYDFDGMLDEVRHYSKALSSEQICVLSQWNPDDPNAMALYPVSGQTDVNMLTDLYWAPSEDPNLDFQKVYFGTDPNNLVFKMNAGPTAGIAPAVLFNDNKPLTPQATYYWRVDSRLDTGVTYTGHTWSFTIETGKAANPVPYDGETDVNNIGITDISWTTSVGLGRNFDVYFGTDESLVEARDLTTQIAYATTSTHIDDFPTPILGEVYYWCVDTNYTSISTYVPGDVWNFRTEPYHIVFNTDDNDANYAGHIIGGYACEIKGPAGMWTYLMTGYLDAAGVAVFDFPSGFAYNDHYDIVVVPEYFAPPLPPGTGNDDTAIPTPLSIRVNGDFYFNGLMDISGDDGDPDPAMRNYSTRARCGGHRGPRKEVTIGDLSRETTDFDYYYQKMEFESHYGEERKHFYSRPTSSSSMPYANPDGGYGAFGLGTSTVAPYKDSGGAGHGGVGGDSGRGYYAAIFSGGDSYSDEEVPIPFGGSAAGWSQSAPGGSGGGGVEIIATGNVTLGSSCQIRAGGGTNPYTTKYPAGGGSGGSIKIIAEGNFTNEGILEADGGDGGDGWEKGNNTGGGGAGGRIAIFYGGTCVSGNISVKGGEKGVVHQSGTYPNHEGLGLSRDGDDGTILIEQFTAVTDEGVRRASAPAPKDGDYMVYAPSYPTSIDLKWYSGYNKTDACDVVYFGQQEANLPMIGSVPALPRGEKSINVDVSPGQTYYFMIQTTGTGFEPVDSDLWSFSTVPWECLEPNMENYDWDPGTCPNEVDPETVLNAGWPAWDQNHDCVVNGADFWYFAQDWRVDRGGDDYMLDDAQLWFFLYQWMTCRGRTNDGCENEGWPITGNYDGDCPIAKPNIYIYPQETIELDVRLVFPSGGYVTNSIPDYNDGWHVTVEPSGLIDGQYTYLFYESTNTDHCQYEYGWLIAREDLEDFFRDNLAATGFVGQEIEDFIDFWIPLWTSYPYYVIYPQYNQEFNEMVILEFSVQPQNLIRLLYSVEGLEEDTLELPEPVIPPFARDGFTVVEWGVNMF